MAVWRWGWGWSEAFLRKMVDDFGKRPVSFTTDPAQMIPENGWTVDGIDTVLGHEAPGPPEPDGMFERVRLGLINYDFSDPRIVEGHFDPEVPLMGRNICLEIKVFGLRYLCGARVTAVREETTEDGTVFGYRYDTLEGHIEQGMEWFLLTKNRETGEIRFTIEARWRLGQFPNWWSKLGFKLIGERFRIRWRHTAPKRLQRLAEHPPVRPVAAPGHLAHRGDIEPEPTRPRRVKA